MIAARMLRAEHEFILKGLSIMTKLCARAESMEADKPVWDELIDFFAVYADKCHHLKEEKTLFPALVNAGLPDRGGPIWVMLHEHDIGRGYLARMRELAKGLPATASELVRAASGYHELLSQHIAKENEVLFVMAERLLSGPDDRAIVEQFQSAELAQLGAGGHDRYERRIDELAATYLR